MFLLKELFHIGTMNQSGRYPRGSGENPQRNKTFSTVVRELKKQGLKEKDIASRFGMTIDDLRAKITTDKNIEDRVRLEKIQTLKDTGMSNQAISKELGINESTVRNFLDPVRQERIKVLNTVESILKDEVDAKPYLDVGKGVELELGVNRTMLDAALYSLKQDGYKTQSVWIEQLGTNKKTEYKILTKEETDYQDIINNKTKIRTVTDFEETSDNIGKKDPVKLVDPDRVMIRYADDKKSGEQYDGMIEVRPGVKDLTLPDGKMYGQVRIAVGDKSLGDTATVDNVKNTRFMKGMVVQGDPKDFPDGVDIIYNTNKKSSVDKMDVFKKPDPKDYNSPDNPFGSNTWQHKFLDENGKEQLSSLNMVGSSSKYKAGLQGAWDQYGKRMPAQFLAKQDQAVAKKQLDLAYDIEKSKISEISGLTNPVLKRSLLLDAADNIDKKAVDMAGAPFPGQSVKVAIGSRTLKDSEVYAPGYPNGTRLGMIRFPYAGNHEMLEVTVNNKNRECQRMLGTQASDAVGLSINNSRKASGADNDGDTFTAFPIVGTGVKAGKAMQDIIDFDTKSWKYSANEMAAKGFKAPSQATRDRNIGIDTNLITDATAKGAPPSHIKDMTMASMVAVDCWKHILNANAANKFYNIPYYKKLYQEGGGAATIMSRAGSGIYVDKSRPLKKGEPGYENSTRYGDYSIDNATGRKIFTSVGFKAPHVNKDGTVFDPSAPYVNKSGRLVSAKPPQQQVKRGYLEEDARNLMSSNPAPIEKVYANFSNQLKSLANQARREAVNTPNIPYSSSAAKTYKSAIDDLTAQIKRAESNAPKERMVNIQAKAIVDLQKAANPKMTASDIRKATAQAQAAMRVKVGAHSYNIQLTDEHVKAIKAGAISTTTMEKIMRHTDSEALIKAFSPKTTQAVSSAMIARARSMANNNYTTAEIAQQLGISTSTLSQYL